MAKRSVAAAVLLCAGAFAQVPCWNVPASPADGGPAIQACLDANPGRTVMLPKLGAPSYGGGQATSADYYSAQTIILKGNGQSLRGDVASVWSGNVQIKFASGIAGVRIPNDCYGCGIESLELRGALNPCPAAAASTLSQTGDGPDGIQLLGGEPLVRNVVVMCFERNGVLISGDSSIMPAPPSQPDAWELDRVMVDANQADGVRAQGGDSNAGLGMRIDARGNKGCGISDQSQLGNTWIAPMAHANTQSYCGRGAVSSSFSTWVGAYCEIGQAPADFGGSAMVLGGDCQGAVSGVKLESASGLFSLRASGARFLSAKDSQFTLDLQAGVTTDEPKAIRFLDYKGAVQWQLYQWSNQWLGIKDGLTDSLPFFVEHNGNTTLRPQTAGGQVKATWNAQTTKPLCYAGHRGMRWTTLGGTGVADVEEVCAKNADESYSWKAIY